MPLDEHTVEELELVMRLPEGKFLVSELPREQRLARNRRARAFQYLRRIEHNKALIAKPYEDDQVRHLRAGIQEFRDLLERAWQRKHS